MKAIPFTIRDRGVRVSGWSPAPGAKQCVLRVLSAIVEEISYENRFRVVGLGMLLGFDWKMKLGFGGFSDSDLKNENDGRRAEV